tara:strand:+ start:57 stop:323 length:267 start_codon:yes stop_codon:yes gene_type:complete
MTKTQYNNQIQFDASDQFIEYIEQARLSSEAKQKFGKSPSQKEFLRGVLYNWIRKYASHVLINDLEGNVPEIIEHKSLKSDVLKNNKE